MIQSRLRSVCTTLLLLAAPLAFAGGGRDRVAGDELPVPVTPGPITVDGDLGEWDPAQAKILGLDMSGGEDSALVRPAFADYSARVALRHDEQALYVAVWWRTPRPLSGVGDAAQVPPGDGLVLHLPVRGMTHLALWRQDATTNRAVLASGSEPFSAGRALPEITQAFRATGATSYTQEVRIPWSALGGRLADSAVHRVGVELCFAGLDPAAGYKAALRELDATGAYQGNRWGGMMCWGYVDGLANLDMTQPSMNPELGAEVALMPAGSKAPANPAVLYLGHEQTRTTRMIAVPAGAIAVDGELSPGEWEAASATTIASEPTLMPGRYAVDVHWAYAPAGLYVGLRWHTAGPHLNISDPGRTGHGYDGGDALQIRLATDRVTHIDAWYHDQSRTGTIGLAYGARFNEGKLANALTAGAQMALKDTPGGGYTQELFLPWALITKDGKPLAEGGKLRAILDVFFSGLEGNRLPFILNARLESGGGLALPVATPRDGYYSAVIEDPDTRRVVRRLWNAVKAGKGQSLPRWDGLTDDGVVAPAKTYQVRGLHHTGVAARYLSSLNNPGSPTWQTDDGTGDWGGDHGNPNSVAADADGVVLGWPAAEDGYGVIGCDADGKKKWGFFGTPANQGYGDCGVGLVAVDGGKVYVASEVHVSPPKDATYLAAFRTAVSCLDRATGRRAGFSLKEPFTVIANLQSSTTRMGWWWDLWPTRDFSLDTRSISEDYGFSGRVIGGNLVGLAALKGRLYVAFRTDGCIKVYDGATMAEQAVWKLDKPGGLCTAPDGSLLAISGTQVVRLDPATGAATPVVRSGLKAPVALAAARDGSIYVSEWADVQCVRVFAPDGSALRTIGRPGGRPWVGAFDPAGMLMPRGLALDAQGRLWVAEDDNHPRRVSVWDAASGRLVREFNGGTLYGASCGGQIAPWDASRALSAGMWYGIDLGQEGYRPLATLDRRRSLDQPFAFDFCSNAAPAKRFMRAGERRFLTAGQHNLALGELQADGTWKALCAIGRASGKSEAQLRWHESPWPAFFQKHPKDNYIWIDRNRDGACQEDEFQWRPMDQEIGSWQVYWSTGGFDAGFNAYLGANGNRVVRIPFGGWDDAGLPRFDITQAAVVARMPAGEFQAVAVDGASAQLFTVVEANSRRWKNKDPGLYSFRADGSLWWRILGNEDVRPLGNLNGECVMGPVDAGGEVGGLISTTQWHGLHVPLITTDGIYVGRVLRDPAEGGEPGPDMFRGECIQYLNRLDDGRVVLAHGKNVHHFFAIDGLDTVKRFATTVTVSAEDARQAQERLQEREAGAQAAAAVAIELRREAVVVDGRLDDWAGVATAPVGPAAGTPRAQVMLRSDGRTLYAAWKVTKNGGYLNAGEDLARLFLSGDAVDLHLCTDAAPVAGRAEPGASDCRIVLGRCGKEGVAMVYRVKARGPAKPLAFSSPNRQVVFEQVERLAGAQVAVAEAEGGYVVEAALPVAALFEDPDALWQGRRILGDVGVIVADATGRRVARLYRFNQAAHIVNDVPSEAVLQPGQWGTLEVRPVARP
jgi:sugar lactone lactonase YvrE